MIIGWTNFFEGTLIAPDVIVVQDWSRAEANVNPSPTKQTGGGTLFDLFNKAKSVASSSQDSPVTDDHVDPSNVTPVKRARLNRKNE